MAGKELIVDDDYCRSMANYFKKQGDKMEKTISDYLTVLTYVKDNAIKSGDAYTALCAYIGFVQKLNGQLRSISSTAKTTTETFISKIDEADQYLF